MIMSSSKCAVRASKKSRFIKGQEASSLAIKAPLSNIPLLVEILF